MSKNLLLYILSFIFFLMSSSWSQTMWTKYQGNPVLQAGTTGEWDENFIYSPSVLFKDGTYHLWYGTYLTTRDLTGYATSQDGINWTKYDDPSTTNPPFAQSDPVLTSGSPGEWDEEIVQPSVLWNDADTLFHMWYMAGGPAPWDARIGYATSPNGTTWTKYDNPATTNPPFAESDPVLFPGPSGSWDDTWVGNPCVILIGNEYHMWYVAYDGSGSVTRIGHAKSLDGIIWDRDPLNPVFVPTPGTWEHPELRNPSVLFFDSDSMYHMWYSGGTFLLWKVGYAKSEDGSTWIRDTLNNPILTPGTFGSWDDITASLGSVIFNHSGFFEMWYTGAPDGQHAHIGHATSPIVINVPGDVPTIQAGIDSASDGSIVLVEEGTYYENINFKGKAITVASRFLVDNDTNHINNTIIDGSQPTNPDSGSVVYFVSGEDTTTILKGFTITGGVGTKYTYASTNQHTGGGLFVWSGAKIENNKIIYNHLTNAGNRYTHGAGIDLETDGNAVVRNNLIANNSIDAWWGGGAGVLMACNDTASIFFEKNTIRDNVYNANGGHCVGGIYLGGSTGYYGTMVFRNNLVLRNEANSTSANMALAGGIYIEEISPILTNNLIVENKTNGWGGGINVSFWGVTTNHANPILVNNTIFDNIAAWGGGISIRGSSAHPKIMNSILWGNTASQQGNEIYLHLGSGSNISVVYSDISGGYNGEGNVSKEPMLRGENYELSDSSSCIGAGILSYQFGTTLVYAPSTCFLGNARPTPFGTIPDMGACESPLDSPVVGLERQLSHNLPKSYDLKQNYPNPFNPSTTIEFDLPTSGEVSLKIFNVLGEEVTTLVSDRLSAGSYSFEWDAAKLASGVYLYRLQAGDYIETRKMVLMR